MQRLHSTSPASPCEFIDPLDVTKDTTLSVALGTIDESIVVLRCAPSTLEGTVDCSALPLVHASPRPCNDASTAGCNAAPPSVGGRPSPAPAMRNPSLASSIGAREPRCRGPTEASTADECASGQRRVASIRRALALFGTLRLTIGGASSPHKQMAGRNLGFRPRVASGTQRRPEAPSGRLWPAWVPSASPDPLSRSGGFSFLCAVPTQIATYLRWSALSVGSHFEKLTRNW